MRNNRRLKHYFIYTALFMAVSFVAFRHFYLNDRTFINNVNDGLVQHYKALTYYSQYLKTIFRNILINHRFVIPQWDFSIGEGADILQTLHMYAIGDPLAFFSVFFSKENMYVWYDTSIIIRLYLSGIAFSELCFYKGKEETYPVLAGSIIYVFCYWSLLNVCEHIYFLNPMIHMPLIILGVERIMNNETSHYLTLAVFISAISNFYFFYMLVLLTVIYVVARMFVKFRLDFGKMFPYIREIFFSSLLGTMMAAVILLPVVSMIIHNSRVAIDNWCGIVYKRLYYERLFAVLLSNDTSYDLCMGFASAVILSSALLLKDKREEARLLLYLMIVAAAIVFFPFLAKIMNGMSYPINRWSFAIALIAAYSVVLEWDELNKNRKYLLVMMFLVFAGGMISGWSRQPRVLVPVALCTVFYLVCQIKMNNKLKDLLKIALIVLNILFISEYDYSPMFSFRASKVATVQETKEELSSKDAAVLRDDLLCDEHTLQRYAGNHLRQNAGMLEGTYSTDFYWSLTNNNVVSTRADLALNDFASYYYQGYDDRASLYSLANVRTFVETHQGEELIPYGFEKTRDKAGYSLYENKYILPFGYTYDKYISYKEWGTLNQIDKQESLLEYVVLDKEDSNLSLKYDFSIDFDMTSDGDIEMLDHKLVVKEEKAILRIRPFGNKSGEYCLNINGLDFDDTDNYIEGNRNWIRIKTIHGNLEKNIYHFPREYQFYSGRYDYTVCYGYSEEGIDEITLVFYYPGVYTYDDLFVSCNDYKEYEKKIGKLTEDYLKELSVYENGLSGSISLDKDKFMLLSIPYSEGFKAFVDGKEVEILKANGDYMALELGAGNHEIELLYQTPFLKVGAVVSVVSMLIFFYTISRRKKK